MVIRAHAHLSYAHFAFVVALGGGLLACNRPETQSEVTRQGDDVIATGPAPHIVDSVPGDIMFAGRELRFEGVVGGDYIGVGGTQNIGGRVHGALRAAGSQTRLAAAVDRNATVAGWTVEVDRIGVIGRNAYFAGNKVHIDGTVRGGLFVSGGTVVLNGPVGGNVQVTAGDLFVGPRAVIAGELRYRVPNGRVHIDPLAHVTGSVTALPAPTASGAGYVFGLLWMFGFLVTGGVVVALLPRLMVDAAELVRELPGRSALIGLGWIVLAPIAIVIVACTVIGLPLALLTGVVYGVLIYIGRVMVAIWVGKTVLGPRTREGRSGALVSFGLGGLVLLLLSMIPVVGPIVTCIATIVGLGALILRVHRLRWTVAGTTFI